MWLSCESILPQVPCNLQSFSHDSTLLLWNVFGFSNELHTQGLSDWWVAGLTTTCIWEKSVRTFICCPQQLNQADNHTPLPSLLPPERMERVGGGYDTPSYSLMYVWRGYLSFLLPLFRWPLLHPTQIDFPAGTPEAISRCWLVSLSLAWSVLSILVNSDPSHTRARSPAPPLIVAPHQSSSLFPFAITLTDNSLQRSLLSPSFTSSWISLSRYLVVSHVLLFHNAERPLSNSESRHSKELPPHPHRDDFD